MEKHAKIITKTFHASGVFVKKQTIGQRKIITKTFVNVRCFCGETYHWST